MIYKRLINLYNYDIILFHLKQLICFMEHMMYCVQYHKDIPYMTKFSLDINFAKPSYLCIAEIFSGIYYHQCGKGCHILN